MFGSMAPRAKQVAIWVAIATLAVPIFSLPAIAAETLCRNATESRYCYRKGDRGDRIYYLIEVLRELGYYNVGNDSYFGPVTEGAVIEFQSDRGLAADGIVGAGTIRQLCREQESRTTQACTEYLTGYSGGRSQSAPGSSIGEGEVSFENCIYNTTWVRPSPSQQVEKLQSAGRSPENRHRYYVNNVAELESSRLWNKDFLFLFPEFGIGGYRRFNFLLIWSGLWSGLGLNDNLSCQEPDIEHKAVRMQVLSLNHEVQSVRWTGEKYLMTARYAGRGFHIVQFDIDKATRRRGFDGESILQVIDEEGNKLADVLYPSHY